MTRYTVLKTLFITASLLLSNNLIAKPHTAKIIGNVSLKIDDVTVKHANETIQLQEGSRICMTAGRGEVSIDNGAKQLTNPPDCAVIEAPQKQGIIKRFIKIAKYLNPLKPNGEQSKQAARGTGNQPPITVTISDPYTAPIVFNNQPYLIINVEQLLNPNSQYPLTLRVYDLKEKPIYTTSNKQANNTLFILPAEFLQNKNGYRLKISDGSSTVLINSILQIGVR